MTQPASHRIVRMPHGMQRMFRPVVASGQVNDPRIDHLPGGLGTMPRKFVMRRDMVAGPARQRPHLPPNFYSA
jgi:hypothetical protein